MAVTASIADTLQRWPGANPVAVTPGQPLPSDKYNVHVGQLVDHGCRTGIVLWKVA